MKPTPPIDSTRSVPGLDAGPASRMMRIGSALICALVAGVGAAACGSSNSSPPSPIVVTAPSVALQGCTYVLGGTVPAGEPEGIQPHFAPFSPDASATSALESIKQHGGSALVNGVDIPGGASLYAGPDTSAPSVGAVPANYAILAAEPVVWKDSKGDSWLGFFLACGGNNLYWVNLSQLNRQNPQAAAAILPLLTKDALVPITIADQNFAWKSSKLTFEIGRGELFGPVA